MMVKRRERDMTLETGATATYLTFIQSWNNQDAATIGACFTASGTMIGFDGSVVEGAEAIATNLGAIFRDHPTPAYVALIDSMRTLAPDLELVRAEVGMARPGETAIASDLNAWQSCLLRRDAGGWRIEWLQTTPAAFHGRPDLVKEMTARLQAALNAAESEAT